MSEPMSLGGELPISRRCHIGNHTVCRGSWTQYPDRSGDCECECHDDQECEGHPAGPFDPMGVTVYCDGTCR